MSRKHAFTLIELLVVISIIALLVSILLPALGHAREVTRTVSCLAQVRQFGIAVATYESDHKGVITTYQYAPPTAALPGEVWQYKVYWYNAYHLYMAGKAVNAATGAPPPLHKMFWCPDDDIVRNNAVIQGWNGVTYNNLSYGLNYNLYTGVGYMAMDWPNGAYAGVRLERITAPSSTLYLADHGREGTWLNNEDAAMVGPFDSIPGNSHNAALGNAHGEVGSYKSNVLYLDMHGKTESNESLSSVNFNSRPWFAYLGQSGTDVGSYYKALTHKFKWW
jgi:prepilin-type N-terminal cleavage/methylation domain-containing protein